MTTPTPPIPPIPPTPLDERMLRLAARLGVRGVGLVEPNPPVGCVIGDETGRVLGAGRHQRFGGPHAEAEALAACTRRGASAHGATVWVTLEPCAHHGKTPPCADALIRAGVARVVAPRADPTAAAGGGFARLRAAGVNVALVDGPPEARRLSDPFVMRTLDARPWVIAKWAQTMDGRVATRTGASAWISCPRSRRLVHRWRGRVDAVLTGVGTVLADDPRLTARGTPVRRTALRVVVDGAARTPLDGALAASARETPVLIAMRRDAPADAAGRAGALRDAGCQVWTCPTGDDGRVDLHSLLRRLAADAGATRVLVEAGPTLVGRLLDDDLIDEARVFVAPMTLADADAAPAAAGRAAPALTDARRFELEHLKRVDADALLWWRRDRSAMT